MNDVFTRAAALRGLLGSSPAREFQQPVAESVIKCAHELMNASAPAEALQLIASAEAEIHREDGVWRLRLEIARVRALRLAGQSRDSLNQIARLYEADRELLRRLPSEFFDLRISEAADFIQLSRYDEAFDKLVRIHTELVGQPDSRQLAACAYQMSSAEIFRGNHASARRYVLEAVVSARRSRDDFTEALALDNLNRLERAVCHWATAEESGVEALKIFVETNCWRYANSARRGLGIIAWKRGRLDAAMKLAMECSSEAERLGEEALVWYAALLRAMILLSEGKYADATRALSESESWKVTASQSRPSLLTTEFLGDIHLEQGQAAPALERYDEVWPKALALVPKGDIVAELRRRRAECYLLLGRSEDAYTEAKTGLDHCRELGDRYEEAATYRVLALSAAALGKTSEAKKWFEQGFAYYDDIETPFEWGKLWMSYGDWLCGAAAAEYADKRGALEAYGAAVDHFERMGAMAKLAEARGRLEKLSAELNPPSAQATDPTGATRRPLRRPRHETELDQRADRAREQFGIVTRHRPLLDLLDEVSKLARSTTPILVLGESGTGKELIAKGVHRLSLRSGNFMPINCGALPREIIESELFGHAMGSFTGAVREKPGILEVCDSGTVFLDEIAEMSPELQSRLLRFLETGEARRIGATRNFAVDTRVVAATNRERTSLESGEGFRTDLYYRLAHAVVTLPPLRRRGDDVGLLVDYFLAESCREESKIVRLSDRAWRALAEHPWPGNVRQLRSVVRRAVILATDGQTVEAEGLELRQGQAATTLVEELDLAEKRRVLEVLGQTRGSRTEAAKLLGIPRTTLLNKLRRYGMLKK
jgi:DNA-binding NtrC family response regulator